MVDLGTTSVLVADDEPSTRAMVARHLRSIGYKVVEAVDGDEAFSLALEHLPDLVVLDVMMPGMSGWEVCRRIRETVSLAHTGVVMLTGIGESLNEITSPLYGADAYLDKPFEFAVLDRTIAETLEGRRGLVGRPDHADVEIVQTMGESDEIGDTARVKPKRARKSAALKSDGAGSNAKPESKRASGRNAKESDSEAGGAAASGIEFENLEVTPKPKKARKAASKGKTDTAPKADANKPRAKAKVEPKSEGEANAPPAATKAKARQGKKAKSKAAKKVAKVTRRKPAAAAKKAKKAKKAAAPRAKKAAASKAKVTKAKKAAAPKAAKAAKKAKKAAATKAKKAAPAVAKKAAKKAVPAAKAKPAKSKKKSKRR